MTTKAAVKPSRRRDEIEVLPAELPDTQLIQTEGGFVQNFLTNLQPFFRTATALEVAAKASLDAAKAFKPPTNGEEDAALQRAIRAAMADKKGIEAHWDITSKLSALHKRFVAGRARGVAMLEEAASIAQRLHNQYAETERRRAQEETERLRREEEDRIRQAQEKEAAKLELDALKAEAESADLSVRETAFVDRLVASDAPIEQAGPDAARYAGFKDPLKAALRLLGTAKIQEAIRSKRAAAALRQQATATRERPVEVEEYAFEPDIQKEGSDRSTWSGEVVNAGRFIDAVFEGGHGIPRDVLMINPVKLNEYARSLHERMDRWPGVRAKKTTKTV